MSKYAIADFARELLAVADNLQRTVAAGERHSPETVEDAALLEGVRATERMLMRALKRFGVRKIEVLGAPFDVSPTLGLVVPAANGLGNGLGIGVTSQLVALVPVLVFTLTLLTPSVRACSSL